MSSYLHYYLGKQTVLIDLTFTSLAQGYVLKHAFVCRFPMEAEISNKGSTQSAEGQLLVLVLDVNTDQVYFVEIYSIDTLILIILICSRKKVVFKSDHPFELLVLQT